MEQDKIVETAIRYVLYRADRFEEHGMSYGIYNVSFSEPNQKIHVVTLITHHLDLIAHLISEESFFGKNIKANPLNAIEDTNAQMYRVTWGEGKRSLLNSIKNEDIQLDGEKLIITLEKIKGFDFMKPYKEHEQFMKFIKDNNQINPFIGNEKVKFLFPNVH